MSREEWGIGQIAANWPILWYTLVMDINLKPPFKGSYLVTFSFGAVPESEEIKKKYQEWGIIGHNGIDYGLSEGVEVLAADSGRVIQSGDNGEYGISITIEHSWGISIYGHLKEVKVSSDTEIKQGDLVGLSGYTGFSSGPHLHFGIKLKDSDINNGYQGFSDPSQYISESVEQSVIPEGERVRSIVIPAEAGIHNTDESLEQKLKDKLLENIKQSNQIRKQKREDNLNKVLELVKLKGEVNNLEVRDLLKVSQSTASYYLTELTKKGVLKIKNKGRSTVYTS